MSTIEHVWDTLDRRVRQRVPVPDNYQQLRTATEEDWEKNSTCYNQQPDQLYAKDICHTTQGKTVVTPDTDWF